MERVGLVPLSWMIFWNGQAYAVEPADFGMGTIELADFGQNRLGTVELADFGKDMLVPSSLLILQGCRGAG